MDQKKSTNIYEAYETDKSLESEGAWVELRPGIKLRIRAETSSVAREYATKLAKQQRNILQANGWVLPPTMQDRNDVLMCRNALVTGWEGVTDRSGKPLPFNAENVEKVLTDLPQLRRDVLFVARTDETYRAVREEMLGNSSEPSKDNSPTGDGTKTSSPQLLNVE